MSFLLDTLPPQFHTNICLSMVPDIHNEIIAFKEANMFANTNATESEIINTINEKIKQIFDNTANGENELDMSLFKIFTLIDIANDALNTTNPVVWQTYYTEFLKVLLYFAIFTCLAPTHCNKIGVHDRDKNNAMVRYFMDNYIKNIKKPGNGSGTNSNMKYKYLNKHKLIVNEIQHFVIADIASVIADYIDYSWYQFIFTFVGIIYKCRRGNHIISAKWRELVEAIGGEGARGELFYLLKSENIIHLNENHIIDKRLITEYDVLSFDAHCFYVRPKDYKQILLRYLFTMFKHYFKKKNIFDNPQEFSELFMNNIWCSNQSYAENLYQRLLSYKSGRLSNPLSLFPDYYRTSGYNQWYFSTTCTYDASFKYDDNFYIKKQQNIQGVFTFIVEEYFVFNRELMQITMNQCIDCAIYFLDTNIFKAENEFKEKLIIYLIHKMKQFNKYIQLQEKHQRFIILKNKLRENNYSYHYATKINKKRSFNDIDTESDMDDDMSDDSDIDSDIEQGAVALVNIRAISKKRKY